jgi:hypothetical protein
METITVKGNSQVIRPEIEITLPFYYREDKSYLDAVYRVFRHESGELRESQVNIDPKTGFVLFVENTFTELKDNAVSIPRHRYTEKMDLFLDFMENKVYELEDEKLSCIGIKEAEYALGE